jgi:hypothetical protein
MKAPANQGIKMALTRGDGSTLSSLSTGNL